MTDRETFWDRLAARTKPAGASTAVENTRTIMWIGTGVMWAAALSAAFTALVFFWFDEPAAGLASLAVMTSYVVAWLAYAATGSALALGVIAVGASLIDIIFIHLVLGGFANSGAYLAWGAINVVGAALLFPRNVAIGVTAVFASSAVILGFFEAPLQASRAAPDPTLTTLLFVIVIGMNIVLVALVAITVLGRLAHERERAEELLLNVLPEEVATELKQHGSTTARRFDSISVLFADIVGFTPMSAEMEPEEMVDQLNDVFTYFDDLAEQYGVEKIRTIGDNYMVASGVPTPRDDHAQALAAMALDMLAFAEAGPLSFRIGINSGPAVAGVIGTRKFQYDVWGDTVNTASRMESHGEAGRIQVSDGTHELIKDTFPTTPRGPIDVKGKGTLNTWWLDTQPLAASV